ncbi:MAG: hypothetical protein IT196_19220 [Acidimicrobiales bacterium]|nr:hypothetical protein [Acidimicrobiales bacterium]
MSDPAEERPRAEPDLFTFEFWSPLATFGGHIALWRWPRLGVAWYATAVFRQGERVVALADEFPLKRTLELRGNGLWADHNVEDPFVHWSIGLEAFALALDDPDDDRGERVPLGYDLDVELDPVTRRELGDGYEQPARVHGEVLLGTDAYDLDGFGWRAHLGLASLAATANGVRTRHGLHGGVPRYTVADGVARPGDDAFGSAVADTPGGRLRKALYREPDGSGAGFTEGWQARPY